MMAQKDNSFAMRGSGSPKGLKGVKDSQNTMVMKKIRLPCETRVARCPAAWRRVLAKKKAPRTVGRPFGQSMKPEQ